MEPVTAYLALGSNLGRRQEHLNRATRLVSLPSPPETGRDPAPDRGIPPDWGAGMLQPMRASSVYETAPWGYADQPDFLNCVLEVQTSLAPCHLLQWVKRLEKEMGREWSPRYGPRVIDVDILLYSDVYVQRPDLQIPHPRLHQRAFVLIPLAELASELVHPTLGLTIQELADGIEGKDGVRPWGSPLKLASGDPTQASA